MIFNGISLQLTPSNFQWNEIEEAYGQKGQKLVGNLVVQDQFSDKQYIEKVIPWNQESNTSDSKDDNNLDEGNDLDTDHNKNED